MSDCLSPQVHYWISVPLLAGIMHKSQKKVRKMYRKIIRDECIPLREIPLKLQKIYAEEYLFRDRLIDFPFLDAIKDYSSSPLHNPAIQELFTEMRMMRDAHRISLAYASSGTVTERLRNLAVQYHISYSTLARRRAIYMNSTPLYRALTNSATDEDTKDRYRTCCFYCRDLIIYLHEQPGKISAAKIFRDIRKAKPFLNNDNTVEAGPVSQSLRELGRAARENAKGNKNK